MSLCELCQNIPFDNLPPLPSHYDTHDLSGREHMLAFMSRGLGRALKNEGEFKAEYEVPVGLPHHQDLEALKKSAAECPVCGIINTVVSRTAQAIEEAMKDPRYEYYSKHYNHPDYRLWIAKRKDDGDGFMVLSYSKPSSVWLMGTVGFCVRDDDEPLSSVLPGRVIEQDPSSDKVLNRALRWVDEDNARTQSAAGDVPLPLRVLDVEADSVPSRIRLYEPNGESGKYITLSHCWGTDQQHLGTSSANIAAHKDGISMEDLPKTFQDAVFLTRKLGVRYLWIDALCICQDDGPDWERESAKMAQTYANSYLTIAATGSKQDSDGCLLPRTAKEYVTFETTLNGIQGTVHAFTIPHLTAANGHEACELKKEPLSKRGWSLQERLIASRTLHFATEQIFFECNTQFVCEDGLRIKGRYNSVDESLYPSKVGEESVKRKTHRGPWLWCSILWSYSNRELTKPSDKLPALTGIARTFEEKTGDEYLAGLWKNSLIEGLIWQAIGTMRGATTAPPEYRAPSWSWASIDGHFGNVGLGNWDSFTPEREWIDVAKVIDVHVEPKGENPYGEVKSAWLKLKAPIIALSFSEEKEKDWDKVPHERAPRVRTEKGDPFGFPCLFDTLGKEAALKLSLSALLLVRDNKEENKNFQALIVTPVEGEEETYRRVGKLLPYEEVLGEYNWEDESQFKVVTLV